MQINTRYAANLRREVKVILCGCEVRHPFTHCVLVESVPMDLKVLVVAVVALLLIAVDNTDGGKGERNFLHRVCIYSYNLITSLMLSFNFLYN